jgi:hypothetical protein
MEPKENPTGGNILNEPMTEFEKELECLINKHSKENGSNTPDFILAKYLNNCLEAYNHAVQFREKWYGRRVRNMGGKI